MVNCHALGDFMEARKIIRSASLLALLVLVISVTGAFADSATNSQSGSVVVSVSSVQVPSPNLQADLLLPTFLPAGPIIALTSVPPPQATTPEPSTVYLFMLGAGMILLSLKRRATQP